MKNLEKTRVRTAVHRIYELFVDKKRLYGKRRILAKDALDQLKGSKPTLVKARKLLGVQSKKIAGRFCWFAPKRTPEEALGRIKKIIYVCMFCPTNPIPGTVRFDAPASEKRIRCPFCHGKNVTRTKSWNREIEELRKYMVFHHLDCPIKDVLRAMKRHLKSKIYTSKRELGIRNYRGEDGVWRWVHVSEDVIDWLGQLLYDRGQIKASEVYALALKEKRWESHVLLERARIKLGSIKKLEINGKEYWRDRNYSLNRKPPTQSKVEVLTLDNDEPDWMPSTSRDRMDRLRWLSKQVRKHRDVPAAHDEALANFKSYKKQMLQRFPDEMSRWRDWGDGEEKITLGEPTARVVGKIKRKVHVDDLEITL
jgi:hypothetical protein